MAPDVPPGRRPPATLAEVAADWLTWHRAYDDPTSPLARRLEVVQGFIARSLDGSPRRTPRLLSLCAGDGRDVVSVLARRGRAGRVEAVLVELDPVLAAHARRRAQAAGVGLEMRRADAGLVASFADVLPVDVLVLCGVLGNLDVAGARALVGWLPHLVAPGGHVVWTRGGSSPDRRPHVRAWFRAAGLRELAFEGAPAPYGVGLNQLAATPPRDDGPRDEGAHDGRPRDVRSAHRPLPEVLFRFAGRP